MASDHGSQPVSASAEILQLGMFLTAVVFTQFPFLGSDNFILAKGLVLTGTAGLALAMLLLSSRTLAVDWTDLLLLGVLTLAVLSASRATNGWDAGLATGTLFASVALFWVSRSLAVRGHSSALLTAAVVIIAVLALLAAVESYTGFQFSARQPGGTVGNRNRLAHLLVCAAPALLLLIARVRDRWTLGFLLLLAPLFALVLVHSRARGGWLAAVLTAGVALLLTLLFLRRRRPRDRTRLRLTLAGVAAATGATLSLVLPHQLAWASDTPYLDSARTIVEFRSGSGAGRLAENGNTLRMLQAFPVLGVGPGNWRIQYPVYAPPEDPSVSGGLLPVRRYPQSEWLGTTAERGLPSGILLLAFAGVLFFRWLKGLRTRTSRRLTSYALAGVTTMVAAGVVGLFDPLLQTPAAGFVLPTLYGVFAAPFSPLRPVRLPVQIRGGLFATVLLGSLYFSQFWARSTWAVVTYARAPALESLERAAAVAPEDYRIRALAAIRWVEIGDCGRATPHIAAARRLYPSAAAMEPLADTCAEATAWGA